MNRIGKIVTILTAVVLAVSLLLSGCAEPTPPPAPTPTPTPTPTPAPPTPAPPETKNWPEFFTTTGGTGIGIAVGPALAKALQDKHGIPGTFVEPPGGGAGAAYVQMIIDGKAQVAVGGGDDVPNQAFRGIGIWEGKGPQPIRAMLTMYVMGVTHMTRAESGIKSVADFRGKRIMDWYPQAPVHGAVTDALLKFHGMTKDDVKAIPMSSIKEANDSLKARTADVSVRACPEKGSTGIEELAKEINLRLISVTQEELDFAIKEIPYVSRGVTIKAGTFTGQDEDVLMVAYLQSILCHQDLPDDFVYELCGFLLDSCGPDTPGDFAQVHPSADWTINKALTAVNYCPLHPGAVKYYQDRGFWTSELDNKQQELLAQIK